MQHKFKQGWGGDQCAKGLFNVKYITAGTFDSMK